MGFSETPQRGLFSPEDWSQLALMGGLSILANNDGRMSTGQLIGQGGLDALAGLAWRKRYEAAMADRAEQDERAAQEWAWKVEDRERQRALQERIAAGDDEAFRTLYPEEWYKTQRQKAAQEHALRMFNLEASLARQKNSQVPAITPKAPAVSPVSPAISPKGSRVLPSLPLGEMPTGNSSSPAMPGTTGNGPTIPLPILPPGVPRLPQKDGNGLTIPQVPLELRKKLKDFRSLPSHSSTLPQNPESGETDPSREFPAAPREVPSRPTAPAMPSESMPTYEGSGLEAGGVYDFEGNEMQVNGAVKWGKQTDILLPDGRKVVGQLDPTGNYFRFFGDVKEKGGKQLPANVLGNITENLAVLDRVRRAGEYSRQNPDSTGIWKGFINDASPDALNWFDKDGTETRALIAELSSAVIKDRSGAAVTASEFPRLKPFIPQIGDTPDVVQSKLKRFYEVVKEEHDLYLKSLQQGGYEVPGWFFEQGSIPYKAEEGDSALDEIWNKGGKK